MPAALDWPVNPYKGLTYYREDDLPLFAGRDQDIDTVCELVGIGSTRILLLHGLTGCGKSSFLRAGLIPALEHEINGYEFLRDATGRPNFLRATDDPLSTIARAIYRFASREYGSVQPEIIGKSDNRTFRLKDSLAVSSAGQAEARDATVETIEIDEAQFVVSVAEDPQILIKTIEKIASQRPKTFVLVIDQAEEVVTLKPEEDGNQARFRFFSFLSDLSRSRYDLKMIVCFRTEYHGKFYAHLRYGADVGRVNDYYLDDLSEDQLVEAIVRPTLEEKTLERGSARDAYAFSYSENVPVLIARSLRSAGLSGGVLPAMQIVCRKLYEGAKSKSPDGRQLFIDENAYFALGGLSGQVIAYLYGELESSLREGFARKARLSDTSVEIEAWRRVLTCLVKPQINGTVSTDVLPEEILAKRARIEGCKIEPEAMFRYLSQDERPILKSVEVTRLTTKIIIRCFSLGHDVLANALQDWSAKPRDVSVNPGIVFKNVKASGRAHSLFHPINVIIPLTPINTIMLRIMLFVTEVAKATERDLKELPYIVCANWLIIRKQSFPRLTSQQPAEKLEYNHLLCLGTFNVPWMQCLDSMFGMLFTGISLFMRWGEGNQNRRNLTPLKEYVTGVQFSTEYMFSAYPFATANDVKAAHRVTRALAELAAIEESLSPEKFQESYAQFVQRIQLDLGSTDVNIRERS